MRYDLKSSDEIKYINNLNLDIVFVIGWQRLIPLQILKKIKFGVFGMHGSSQNLPKGRGRSPMNWSIIEGRNFFYTNLFKYSEGVDDGDILDTKKFRISNNDTSETMHFKNMISMKYLIFKNISALLSGDFILKPQQKITPTYYPKRNPEDSQIDWSMKIDHIDRLIRAVTKPFNGAFSFIKSNKVIIYSAQLFKYSNPEYKKFKYGTIVEILSKTKFLVRCKGGLLIVNDFHCRIKFSKGDILKTKYEDLKIFKKNSNGFYDTKKLM